MDRRNGMRVLYAGNPDFGRNIYRELEKRGLEKSFYSVDVKFFPNNEIIVRIPKKTNLRRKRVYVVWGVTGYRSGHIDPNVQLMSLLIANDAVRRASAGEIYNIVPFLPYMRQDRKDRGKAPITARLVADLLQESGTDHLVTVHMHSKQAEGFFKIPVDHLQSYPLFINEIFGNGNVNPDECCIMGPDMGAAPLSRSWKGWLKRKYDIDIRLGVSDKVRDDEGVPELQYVIGEVENKDIIGVDDMGDSGGSIVDFAGKVRQKGAKEVVVATTHGIFSRKNGIKAEDRLRDAGIKVYTTDSIPRTRRYLKANKDWLCRVSLAPLLAEAIMELDKTDGSLSKLFDPKADLDYLL